MKTERSYFRTAASSSLSCLFSLIPLNFGVMAQSGQNPGPMVTGPGGQVLAPAGGKLPKKYHRNLIRERRQQVRELMEKGVTSAARIAPIVGVSEETIRQDVKAIHKENKDRLTKKAGPAHVGEMLAQIERVIVTSTADYMKLTDKSPRGASVRAQINQTISRAIALKTQLLMQTGVIGGDITEVDKIVEAEKAEARVKENLGPFQTVLENVESRRKVLDLVEKLKAAPVEAQEAIINALSEEPKPNGADGGDH